MLFATARITVAAIAGIFGIYYFFQPHLLYHPNHEISATPASLNLAFENIYFKTSDGKKLNGWFVPAKKPKGTILFCHGNAGNISNRLDSIKIFNSLGYSTFIFDYRGFGLSEGELTEQGTYNDAQGAWNYLIVMQKMPDRSIIIMGRSLGGSIAAWLVQGKGAKALVLESTFTSFKDIAQFHYPRLPVSLLARFRYDTLEYIKKARCPVLVIHSPDDEIAPYDQGRRIFD